MWMPRILLFLSRRSSRRQDAQFQKATVGSLEFESGFIPLPKHHPGSQVSTLKNTVSPQSCIKGPKDIPTTPISPCSPLHRRSHSLHAPLLSEKFRDSST